MSLTWILSAMSLVFIPSLIMVMQNGSVVEEGATRDVFAAPKHPYTKALFEAAPGREFGSRLTGDPD